MIGSRGRHVGGARGCPTVRAGIVSTAAVHSVRASEATPNYHFADRSTPLCARNDAAGALVVLVVVQLSVLGLYLPPVLKRL